MPHIHFEIRNQSLIADRGYTFYPFEGATSIDAYGMTFYSPSWFINNHRHLNSPFGRVDRTKRVPGGFQVSGWAFDPDTPAFIAVHVYVDGQLASVVAASQERPDIGASFPGRGTAHGFSANVGAMAGNHSYCAYAINAGPGNNSLISCGSFYVNGSPIGALEGVSADTGGHLNFSGWVLDPDTDSPIDVHLYVNGGFAAAATAEGDRGDVGGMYPEYGTRHGFSATAPVLASDNTICAYGISVSGGDNALLGCKTVHNAWDSYPITTPPSGRHYYWPWYDSAGGSNWVLMASPSAGGPLSFDLNIAGKSLDLATFGGPSVNAGETLFPSYGGLTGGPVVATSLTGGRALASQRILWEGNSLEEVPATESEKLSDHFYWTWYDGVSTGYTNYVVVANPNAATVYYRIKIAGENQGQGSWGSIAAGGSVFWRDDTKQGGPVEAEAWSDNVDGVVPADVLASQRVLSNNGHAFNEVPGTSATDISDSYLWTWYDSVGSSGSNWIIIANPSDGPAGLYYRIKVGGTEEVQCAGPVDQNKSVFWSRSGLRNGPAELMTYSDDSCGTPEASVASQRVIWGPSFEEVPGYRFTSLASSYHWTWYDMLSPGAQNWVMITNPNGNSVNYTIQIGGAVAPGGTRTIDAGKSVYRTFDGSIGGPVQVTASDNVLASQRVLWKGYFNETLGTVLN